MDIDYLLFLQRFRESVHDVPTPFMEEISLFAVTFLLMAPVFVYWAVDKKKGLYALAAFCLCRALNSVVKLTACVNRPWIRDPRVVPAGDAIRTATGYSFPSGHTAVAGSIYGGLAVAFRHRKWIVAPCAVLLGLTAFSRNYLGVHTPQDVLVGLLETALVLFAAAKVFAWTARRPEKENLLLASCFLAGCLGLVYIACKPYPMEYVGGNLLVDPRRMMVDGYGDLALLLAFPVSRFVEKTWIRFDPATLGSAAPLVGVLGLVPLGCMINWLGGPLHALLGNHWGNFANKFLLVFYCIALYPLVIKAVGLWMARKAAPREKRDKGKPQP